MSMQTPELKKTHSESASAAKDSAAHAQWLVWLHEMLPDVTELMLFDIRPNQTIELRAANPITCVPKDADNNAVLSCVHRQRALYLDKVADTDKHLLAIPFTHEGSGNAYVLVMRTSAWSEIQQKTAVQLSLWASSQLRESTDSRPIENHLASVPEAQLAQLLIGSLDRHGSFTGIAFTLVNTLANMCGCVRVSLGCHNGSTVQLVAMSGQSRIDQRRQISRQLCALMQETVETDRAVYPNSDDVSAPAMQAYYKSQGEHPLLSFAIPSAQQDKFVLVMERDDAQPFVSAQADAIEQSVHSLGSLLTMTHYNELPLAKKLTRFCRETVASFGQVGMWSKRRWLSSIAGVVLLASFIIPVTHRVSADAYIEASDRQVLVAAQDGFILSAHARAGEVVSKGDLLATLDGQDLQLAAEKWRSEKTKNQQEYAQALAIHDRSELSRLRADEQRIDAEIALLEQQLQRSEVRAPFDGVLLDGDWTQSLGAPVSTGDVLFEIASAEEYRLVLEIDEHDIGYIQSQQLAELRMAALPTSVWKAELGDILPVAVSEKGRSAFRVPAIIEAGANALRPGMEGVGKVSIGKRSMFWVYTHRLVDKLRYMGWKVGVL